MAQVPVTVIAEWDYPAFYRLCGGRIEPTYGAWKWRRDLNHRDEVAGAHELVPIDITPRELEEFCRKRRCQADSTAIRLLTEEKCSAVLREGSCT